MIQGYSIAFFLVTRTFTLHICIMSLIQIKLVKNGFLIFHLESDLKCKVELLSVLQFPIYDLPKPFKKQFYYLLT